jgi:hypothetical protein
VVVKDGPISPEAPDNERHNLVKINKLALYTFRCDSG